MYRFEPCVHVGAKHVESGIHVGAKQVELADDIVESGVLGLTVVVNHDSVFLGECEIAGGMWRSVTQDVLWVSSTVQYFEP